MKRFTTLLATASLMAGLGLVAPALAQVASQPTTLTVIDPVVLASGWRATELIGANIYNDAGEDIGELEDMIITANETVPYVVVSVGGFLGMGEHRVVVAASSLEFVGEKLTLHGATEESLRALPDFVFGS